MTATTRDLAESVSAISRSSISRTSHAVLDRYDELATLVTDVARRPRCDPHATSAASAVILLEARLLDAGRFADWLELWSDEAVLWVPLSAPAHPGTDQSLLLDDRRRLVERVAWRLDESAWGQQPPSLTTRIIGGIEAWPTSTGIIARSSLLIAEQRHGRHQQLAGHQIHEFVGSTLRVRSKILLMPALSTGVRNPSFLL